MVAEPRFCPNGADKSSGPSAPHRLRHLCNDSELASPRLRNGVTSMRRLTTRTDLCFASRCRRTLLPPGLPRARLVCKLTRKGCGQMRQRTPCPQWFCHGFPSRIHKMALLQRRQHEHVDVGAATPEAMSLMRAATPRRMPPLRWRAPLPSIADAADHKMGQVWRQEAKQTGAKAMGKRK